MMLVHITSRSQWQNAQSSGSYRASSLETEGFIHCSTPAQVLWVANQFYRGETDLVLLCIDPAKIIAELRYDTIATGAHFPHIYGELNLDAVTGVLDFAPSADGTFELPAALIG